ncbi:DNA repair protein RecN [Salinispira pacifica]|uniref:DNA repair protein RecN n=1 Tax=Salinispira pacifica TaxID=1307761 RepID=V5WG16_9SPIO|nr:DNA repair protein RecN [Salinispira pacifica]AHC14550.1 DNA repair protein RecN [Salinispira pacifica]
MLENLHIENYALIERLELDFARGMNTLTGETGAGKSILAGALNVLLGGKATTGAIRKGAEQAVVSGSFLLPSSGDAASACRDWLDERGIEFEEERVILRRVLKSTGKGNSFIQGSIVPRQQLAEFTSILIDMHGQHEHQSLFNIQHHRRFIDSYSACDDLRESVQRDFLFLNEKKEELESLLNDERDRQEEIDYLNFSIKDIQELDPQPDEDTELDKERQKLQQYEQLFANVEKAYDALHDNEASAYGLVYSGMSALAAAAEIDPQLKENSERLESLYYELEDVVAQISGYKDDLNYDPQRLEFIEERLAELSRVKRKHGPRLSDVRDFLEQAQIKVQQLENADDYSQRLEKEIRELEQALIEKAKRLSTARKEGGKKLEEQVQQSLQALSMKKARFRVSVTQKMSDRGIPVCGATGIDRVEFLLSANEGESLKPLRSIASGGELSRVMLAIKTALAESDDIPTLVFDEIDSGIGGEVGRALGEHLRSLSRSKQILCITHLASIASHADAHIKVMKNEQNGRTITSAEHIQADARVEEVARMLSGDSSTQASLEHARQLLASASKIR